MVHVGQKLDTGSIGQFWIKTLSGDSHTVIGARSEVGCGVSRSRWELARYLPLCIVSGLLTWSLHMG